MLRVQLYSWDWNYRILCGGWDRRQQMKIDLLWRLRSPVACRRLKWVIPWVIEFALMGYTLVPSMKSVGEISSEIWPVVYIFTHFYLLKNRNGRKRMFQMKETGEVIILLNYTENATLKQTCQALCRLAGSVPFGRLCLMFVSVLRFQCNIRG